MVCCRNSNHFDGDLRGELRQLTVLYPTLEYVAIERAARQLLNAQDGAVGLINVYPRVGIADDPGGAHGTSL